MSEIPVISQRLEPGIGFTSIPLDLTTPLVDGDAPVEIWNGFAHGFLITSKGTQANSPYLLVNVRGVGKKSNDVLLVTPGIFYRCPFDALSVVPNPVAGNTQDFFGNFIVNIAVKSYAVPYPISPPPNAFEIPALNGGCPPMRWGLVGSNLLTQVAPTLATEGVAVSTASTFLGIVQAVNSGGLITGGVVDVYRLFTTIGSTVWVMTAQDVALPTGARYAAISSDAIGPRVAGIVGPNTSLNTANAAIDRLCIVPRAVTVSAGTTINAYVVIQ